MQANKDRNIEIIMGVIIVILLGMILFGNNDKKDSDRMEKEDAMMEGTMEKEEGAMMKNDNAMMEKSATDGSDPGPTATSAYSGAGCTPSLSGEKSAEYNAILLNWTPCANLDEFQFYKLVKSSINENPGYPADPVAMSSADKNMSNYIDKVVSRATTYHYRMCVVQRLGKVTCSNKVTVSY